MSDSLDSLYGKALAAGSRYVERALTETEAEALWLEIWGRGKHGEWGTETVEMPGKGRDARWVLVKLPLSWLHFDWEDAGAGEAKTARATAYAARGGVFPPGVGLLNERTARKARERGETPKVYMADGNHRGLAASLRGDKTFRVLMPMSDFGRVLSFRTS